jgi:tetratricopeptide (TPR) repeat protein
MATDESGTLARLTKLRTEVIEPKVVLFHGRIVGSAGDSLLVEFASAVNAVQCAIETQEELAHWNASLPENKRMIFRMGVNLGDVIAESDTIHGDGVNVASRLEKLAEPGSVYIGRAVYDQVKGKLPCTYADLGEQRLHNIPEPVRVYRVKSSKPSGDISAGPSDKDTLPLPNKPPIAGREQLHRGRSSYSRRCWADAFDALSQADRISPLEADDLECLATAAYLVGRDEDYLAILERAYRQRLDAGERRLAVRCGFWIGLRLLFRGETGHATGWLARAQRLLEPDDCECAERGYLMLPEVEQQLATGDDQSAYAIATAAAEIGERVRDPDLTACARHLQGKIRIRHGQMAQGLALLDEAMVAVSAGELSPVMTGLLFCSIIDLYQEVYALDRAREWTFGLGRWCEAQPQMVAFTGVCQVHRVEIMRRHGSWREAIKEARLAAERCKGTNRHAAAAACYQEAEVHRLRGEFGAAEASYASASRLGLEPQPGLALLRLAKGQVAVAVTAIRRAMKEAREPLQRARLLPAYVEIVLAGGYLQDARDACRELEQIAATADARALRAMAAYARGAVDLADGKTDAALVSLRRALEVWLQVEMPYEVARTRGLVGLACRAAGDEEGAKLELEAAEATFEQLGATPDLSRFGPLSEHDQ